MKAVCQPAEERLHVCGLRAADDRPFASLVSCCLLPEVKLRPHPLRGIAATTRRADCPRYTAYLYCCLLPIAYCLNFSVLHKFS